MIFRSFELRDNGELILTSSGPFNSTLARLVAVASDSGNPPRFITLLNIDITIYIILNEKKL